MKKLIAATCLIIAICLPAVAGDIPGDRQPPPPPACTENCTSATAGEGDEGAPLLPIDLIEVILSLLTLRP